MSNTSPLTIVNVGFRSTNYWVISVGASRMIVDLGYPGTLGIMQANLKRMGVPLKELRYALATHYHIDHAGLAQELKQLGVPLLVLETQVEWIPKMKRWTKPQDNYTDISLEGNVTISFDESRERLKQIGLAGAILPTPGHSDDSVSLLLDDGSVFTGDLTPFIYADGEYADTVKASWHLLKEHGAKLVYPGHGPVYPMDPEA